LEKIKTDNNMQEKFAESNCHVLIPCAGSGSRFGDVIPKQYQLLSGKLMIDHAIDLFMGLSVIQTIWIGTNPNDDVLTGRISDKLRVTPTGGQTRAHTVLNTLKLMIEQQIPINDWILVHDAARPGLRVDNLIHLIHNVQSEKDCVGGILAIPVADTVKKMNPQNQLVESTINRDHLWLAQTPQMFRLGDLKNALEQTLEQGISITDEASAMEAIGLQPLVVKGSLENFKITYQEDLNMMEKLTRPQTRIRVGQGYDVHRLVADRPLILGGIQIPYELGLLGHSDADALLHAITDALLGASGMGDIGQHFPDTDAQFKNIDSKLLLEKTYHLITQKGFEIVNIDATIICQKPKLAQHLPKMIDTISDLLQIKPQSINLKAKTNEGLGYLGNSEAIETQAIVLLQMNP
jgi:2-C-methyl-D-erythritol 4-phosphate cytidylyltransferase / 2-C-methyl-D-erythritol 2,4-cyclodiphosphate synthase